MALARHLAHRGKTVALVLHDLTLSLSGADRVVLLSGGRLVGASDPETLFLSGALDQAFGVLVQRVMTPEGWLYYCVPKK